MVAVTKKSIVLPLLLVTLAIPGGLCPAATVSGTIPASWLADSGQPADGFWRLPLAPRPAPLRKPALVVLLPRQAVPQTASVDKVTVALDSVSLSPPLVLVRVGQKLELVNNSRLQHTCHARGSNKFATGPLKSGGHFEQAIEHQGAFEISCSGLPAGRATVLAAATSFAARVDSSGRFSLDAVPAGDYLVKTFVGNAWKDERPLHVARANITIDFEQAPTKATKKTAPAPARVEATSHRPAAPEKPRPAARKPPARTAAPRGKPATPAASASQPAAKPAAAAKPSPRPAATQPAVKDRAAAGTKPVDKKPATKKEAPRPAPAKAAPPKPKSPDKAAPVNEKPVFKDVEPEIEIEEE
ncbi:MAG: hypothetical protein DRI34_09440 [Deltaproteobacteria bacterium]|nr:MAG: hypothetical protein DRI34_09440 [Deltaproteobacteria bacterium]